MINFKKFLLAVTVSGILSVATFACGTFTWGDTNCPLTSSSTTADGTQYCRYECPNGAKVFIKVNPGPATVETNV